MARDAKIIIRVPDEVKEQFQFQAESMGMTMSALGAYCIGRYLSEEKHRKQMQEKMIEMISPQIVEKGTKLELDSPHVQMIMKEMIGQLISKV